MINRRSRDDSYAQFILCFVHSSNYNLSIVYRISDIRYTLIKSNIMNNTKNFITLREAAKISGYHQDYLGYLVRKGKLNGQKIGRSWMTSRNDLDAFLQSRSTSFFRDMIFSRFGWFSFDCRYRHYFFCGG